MEEQRASGQPSATEPPSAEPENVPAGERGDPSPESAGAAPADELAADAPGSSGSSDATTDTGDVPTGYPRHLDVMDDASVRTVPGLGRLSAVWWPLARVGAGTLFAAALLPMAIALLVGLAATRGEWASGALGAGVAALAAGGFYLIGLIAGAGAGQRARRAALPSLAVAVVLVGLGGVGLGLVNPLHLAQARALEASHDWAGAVREYQLAGQRAPASHDLARVYDEWGEDLADHGRYAGALANYLTVLTTYPAATGEDRRAVADLTQTYTIWLDGASGDLPYDAILQGLSSDLQASWCDASCQTSLADLQAQARLQYGAVLAGEQRYTLAIAQFNLVVSQLPGSPYAARAHAAAATAYYGLGQSQLTVGICANAVTTFQTLASKYGDTPEGGKARAALAAPVDVTGSLKGYPANQVPTMYLSKHVLGDRYYYIFSKDYSAPLDASGRFTFHQVQQGQYYLSAILADGSGTYWRDKNTGNLYSVVVGPLCTVQMGTFSARN